MIPIAKPQIGEDEISLIGEVLKSGMLVEGQNVEKFQNEFRNFVRAKHAITVA
ncbi:MAG: DegT/DnrJ/EryC1/StrS family aminotransferase, partial [Promethearchaeota archaeon]